MATSRRDFLTGAAWMGAAALAAGCMTNRGAGNVTGSMMDFAAKPIKKLRVGVIGLGRGAGAVHRMAQIPGTEVTAICDLNAARIANQVNWFKAQGKKMPKVYTGGEEEWKKLCASGDVDLVYNATPWALHVPIALFAMEHGKHVAIEVPAALTLEDCWALIETSERTRCHCMQLENCCYGATEMLALNMARLGVLGDLVHAECAYIHDLRAYCYDKFDPATGGGGYWDYWRLKYNEAHNGNQYETHGLGPVCQYMNITRGDNFDFLVSVSSKQANFEAYAKSKFPAGSWQADKKVKMGDMNTTIIKTKLGRTIMVQHDVSSPRPYDRINLISGTKGILRDYPLRIALEQTPGDRGAHDFDSKKTEEYREKYKHPLWKKAGELAKKVGGHGGMDFLMDLRLSYCLQNGLPLDQSVYDLATWCCLGELTEKSDNARGRSIDIPDFTNGVWKTAKPLGIVDIDLAKLGLNADVLKKDANALNV